MWTAPAMGTGHLIRIGDQILCLTEGGELILFKAKSRGFEIELRQQVLRGREIPFCLFGWKNSRPG